MGIEIKDAAHAVRVLKALVEQIEKQRDDNTQMGRLNRPLPTELGWAEGAKVILEDHAFASSGNWTTWNEELGKRIDISDAVKEDADIITVKLARAYAPRMKEAGMEVPE